MKLFHIRARIGPIPAFVWPHRDTRRTAPLIRDITARFAGRQVVELVAPTRLRLDVTVESLFILFGVARVRGIERPLLPLRVEKDYVVVGAEAPGVVVGVGTLPDDLVLKIVRAEDPIESHFDVVAGVPIAMEIEAARSLENAVELTHSRLDETKICLNALVPVFEGPALSSLAPEGFILSVGVEWWVNVDEVD